MQCGAVLVHCIHCSDEQWQTRLHNVPRPRIRRAARFLSIHVRKDCRQLWCCRTHCRNDKHEWKDGYGVANRLSIVALSCI